jgi:sugar (pentulose or hexulose) kinase
MTNEHRIVGVDIGSTSIKGALLDLDSGTITDIVREPFPDPVAGLPTHHFEVDPQQVVDRVTRVIRSLIDTAPEATAVMFSGQMGGILLVDSHGQPLTNYLSWRDQRTTIPSEVGGPSPLEILRSRWSDSMFRDIGRELKPGSATSLLFWLAENRRLPEQAIPVTIGDFVTSQLCGSKPAIERTQTIGMLNLRTGNWHHDAFAPIGIAELHWPQLIDSEQPVGIMSLDGRHLTVYPAVGDQQAALRGIDLGADELSINVSTGSQVSQITDAFQPADCQTRTWFGGRYLNTVTHIPAGRSLSVLEALLTELPRRAGLSVTNSWQLIAEESSKASSGGLKVDLSFFAGATGSEGRIDGITTENLTVGNLFDAALDFMADSFLQCSHRLSPHPSWKRLAVSGGLVQSFVSLRKKLNDRFQLPLRESAEQEETLLGLLKLARNRYE